MLLVILRLRFRLSQPARIHFGIRCIRDNAAKIVVFIATKVARITKKRDCIKDSGSKIP